MFSSLYNSRSSISLLCPVIGGKNGQAQGYQSNTRNYSSYRSLVGWLIICFCKLFICTTRKLHNGETIGLKKKVALP